MAGRSPARFLAPLALVAFALALFVVVDRTTSGNDEQESGAQQATPPADATATPKKGKKKKQKSAPETYTVKPGDTPSGIAEKFDVPLETIEELNPDIDPQTLTPGTELKLSP